MASLLIWLLCILWIETCASAEQASDEVGGGDDEYDDEYNVVPMVHYHSYEKPNDTGNQSWLDEYELLGANKDVLLIAAITILVCVSFISCVVYKCIRANSSKNAHNGDSDTEAEIEKEPLNNAWIEAI